MKELEILGGRSIYYFVCMIYICEKYNRLCKLKKKNKCGNKCTVVFLMQVIMYKKHNKIVEKYCSENRQKYFKPCKHIALN